jgi:cardiolipin synthase
MTSAATKQIPNALTTLRLLLAVPICWLILDKNYPVVLWVAAIAGITDGVDGWIARKLDATSRYGAIVDPLADKVLLNSVYTSFAVVGLLPWWVAAIVVLRDLVIVTGALAYHWRFGAYDAMPSAWGKASTLVQIVFAVILLTYQVYPLFPAFLLSVGQWTLIVLAFASGGHYVYTWAAKALTNSK